MLVLLVNAPKGTIKGNEQTSEVNGQRLIGETAAGIEIEPLYEKPNGPLR